MAFGTELATRVALDPLNGTIMGLQGLIMAHSLAEIPVVMSQHPGIAVLDLAFVGLFAVLTKNRYRRTDPLYDSYTDTKEYLAKNGWNEDAMAEVHGLQPRAAKYASIDMKFKKEYKTLVEHIQEQK